MSVFVRCTCGYRMELPDTWAGKQGRCPQCGAVLQVPHTGRTRAQSGESVRALSARDRRDPVAVAAVATVDSRGLIRRSLLELLRNRVWLSVVGAGVSLVVISMILLFRGHTAPKADTGDAALTQRVAGPEPIHGGQSADVFRPAVRPQDAGIESISSLPQFGNSEPQLGTKADRSRLASLPTRTTAADTLDTCRLGDFGVEIPAGASMLEIDGVPMRVQDAAALAGRGSVPLVLPMGKHIVRFATNSPPQVVEPRRWFLDGYRSAAASVQEDGRWSFDRLLELSRRNLDRFTEPLVPHFWGNFYWQEGERAAAARHFSWALELAPTFAPSYLNLSQLAHDQGDDAAAQRYLRLADLWNVQNAYGISLASSQLWLSLGQEALPPGDEEPDWLVPRHDELARRDRDMIAILKSAAEFAPELKERAKVLNNLGAYFEHVGKPELALEHYRLATAALGKGELNPDERRVIEAILDNLARVCRAADMPEYRRYERMRAMVEP